MVWSSPQKVAVVSVGYLRFGPGSGASYPASLSRVLAWCKFGSGTVRVAEDSFPVESDDYLFVPWAQPLSYRASPRGSVCLGVVHLVPDHDLDHPIHFALATEQPPASRSASWCKDRPLDGLEGLVRGNFVRDQHVALGHLAEYTVQRFVHGVPDDALLRSLGHLLVAELHRSLRAGEPHYRNVPVELDRILKYIGEHLEQPLTLQDLASFAQLSLSSVERLFKEHLKCTPKQWILGNRLRRARHLLFTTPLQVSQVAQRVGIEDPFYFSKVFRKEYGISPNKLRKMGNYTAF